MQIIWRMSFKTLLNSGSDRSTPKVTIYTNDRGLNDLAFNGLIVTKQRDIKHYNTVF